MLRPARMLVLEPILALMTLYISLSFGKSSLSAVYLTTKLTASQACCTISSWRTLPLSPANAAGMQPLPRCRFWP